MLEVLARIRHRRIRRQLSPYLDGMLSARGSRRLEAHLAQCQACRDELAELQATVRALAELPLAEAPRSFALAAAPAPVVRPPARRVEFGLRLATAAAAFVLAVVLVGDFAGLPGGDEEEQPAALQMRPLAEATETGVREQGTLEPQPSEATAEDKAVTEAPTAPPAGAGEVEGEATAVPPATVTVTVPQMTAPGAGVATPAATAAPAAAPAPAETPAPAATPAPTDTPAPTEAPPFAFGLAGTPEAVSPTVTPAAPAATATPPPVGAQIAPSEPEQPLPAEADEQAPAGAEREAPAAEEGGPSRETVVRWLEIGLATGLALLFVSWVLARRRGWA